MAICGPIKPYHAAALGGPTKVWCIGDSRMRGAEPRPGGGFSYNGGARQWLYAAMTAAGAQPDFVGTQLNSSESPAVTNCGTGHDGLDGSSAAQWLASYFATKVAQFPNAAAMPHIIWIDLGTNDGDVSGTGTTIAGIVDLAIASAPLANIFVATVLPSVGVTRIATNAQLRTEIATRVAKGYHVQLVEMEQLAQATVNNVDMPDTLHPSASLYRRMGEAMALSVVPLL